jgi:cardiolipin synthase
MYACPCRHEFADEGSLVGKPPPIPVSRQQGSSYHSFDDSYFLPDENFRLELVTAIRERGVEVAIVVPGSKSDHLLTRSSSRALFGELLEAGARIYEYPPSMIHTKVALIDGLWAVVGSTNVDSRSFVLNDEVNVAVRDADVAKRLEEDFQSDMQNGRQVSLAEWKGRPIWNGSTSGLVG